MKRGLTALLLLVFLASASAAIAATPTRPSSLPRGFFGIAPQTELTVADARYMKAGGIESVRVPVSWSSIQPTAKGGYNWSGLDQRLRSPHGQGFGSFPFSIRLPAG